MRLLKNILESVTEKLLDAFEGAAGLFVKGCQPLPVHSFEQWLAETNVSKIDPVVPYGGF